ncbi:cysteine proteinase inhibitor 5-like [Salvia hispanica]|uniref:cysteine proteinase inhibitor 5-like n=1 Tax=Salvia hispanica TaxID=49212 RepID=UPI0020090BE7|nr:cysteine proteinase inhibitor 5-like [Salvia hispanica]
MAPKSVHTLLASLALLAIAHSASAARGPLAGGWTPIADPNAPEIVKLAKFAVAQHNFEAKTGFALNSVLKAESQVANGVKYRLEMDVGGGSGPPPYIYSAVVWTKPAMGVQQLDSFDQIIKA